MKNIGDGYWNYNGCDVYLAEHPKLHGKYEIYKGCYFVSRAYNLKEAKQIIIDKFGKMSGGIMGKSVDKPKYPEKTDVSKSFHCAKGCKEICMNCEIERIRNKHR